MVATLVSSPRLMEDSDTVFIPGIVHTRIARVAEICSLLSTVGESKIESWNELINLVDDIEKAVTYAS